MKKIFLALLLFALSSQSLIAQHQPNLPQGRKRVAVVLSGGGAKGVAHIGALRVIEQAGIPIDIITGTSMGSIVGGLYALGYHADALDSIVSMQDWSFILSDREDLSNQNLSDREKQNTYMLSRSFARGKHDVSQGGFVKGKNLADLFARLTAGYNDSIDFNTLPIPFACVATDIVTNTEYDFHSGRLAQAMRASMAIPGVFSPIRMGDMVLVDGGLRNNFPADLAREMGADIIIGVTVQGTPRTADDLGSAASILGQIVDVNCKNKYDDNLAITDVPIRVNTVGYSSASFNHAAIDTLIRRGEEEAMRHWDELIALKARIGIDDTFAPRKITPPRAMAVGSKVKITRIEFQGTTPNDETFLRKKFHLHRLDSISAEQADIITTSMRVDLFYMEASNRFHPNNDGTARLVFTAGKKKLAQVGLGVRFDTEELVALQLNGSLPLRMKMPAEVDVTMRLGKRIMLRGDLAFHPRSFTKPTLSYIFRHNELDVYTQGDKDYNITFNQHAAELSLFNFNLRNLNCIIGMRWDFFNYRDVLIEHHANPIADIRSDEHFYSYYARLAYNSENDWYFPSRGAKFKAQYAYYTDNFGKLYDRIGMSDVSASWRMNFTMGSRFTLQPMMYGRMLFGGAKPTVLSNVIGGEWFGHYLDQQMPFAGVGYIERTDPHFVGLQLQGQQRIATNNFVLLRVGIAQHAPQLGDLLRQKTLFGTSIAYYYKTPFGPIGASLGYSNKSKGLYLFVNLGYVF